MSLTFKLFSLGIRTLAKPIGNYIKKQTKEHEGFRRFAINQAQRVHRIDMRMRLGILHDPAAQERMHERERKAAEEKKKKQETPIVRTEKEQQEYDQRKEREEKAEKEGSKKKEEKPKIRPLSDARAIELGANFFSETFIFAVAVGLLLLENWRSRSKESSRRDVVTERFEAIEADLERLKKEHNLPDLEALNDRIKRVREERERYSWYNPADWWSRFSPRSSNGSVEGVAGEVEEEAPSSDQACVPNNSPAKQATPLPPKSEAPAETEKPDQHPKSSRSQAKDRVDTVSAEVKQR